MPPIYHPLLLFTRKKNIIFILLINSIKMSLDLYALELILQAGSVGVRFIKIIIIR